MRLLIDVMGGDYAPLSILEGAFDVVSELPDNATLVLIGDESEINSYIEKHNCDTSKIEIIHSAEVIGMGEHPAKAFASKQNSSIGIGFKLLKSGEGDAFCSAGNTGAMLVGSMMTIKAVEGIIRPGIASFIPNEKGGFKLLLDAGANADCKADVLDQFAHLASLYSQHVMGVSNPKIGLMNLGEEEQKGTLLTQAAHQLLKINKNINFIGNIEGGDCFNDKADVIICDGFTGNVILKMAESFYGATKRRKLNDEFLDMFNYEEVGGSPILGVNGNVIIGHGASSPKAIKNMILMAKRQVENKIHFKIKEAFDNV